MPNILTVNDDVTTPGVIVCVDIATNVEQDARDPKRSYHTLRCGTAVAARVEGYRWTRQKWLQFKTGQDLFSWLDFVRIAQRPIWLFANNAATTLTMLGLWQRLTDGEFTLHHIQDSSQGGWPYNGNKPKEPRVRSGLLVDKAPPTIVICYHRRGWKCVFLDVRNYIDKPVADLSQASGVSINPVPHYLDDDDKWYEYSKSRCSVTLECVRRLVLWHKKQELGKFAFSIAGIALAAFRHRFMRDYIHLPESQDERDYERDAYYNGRVEALWCGRITDNRYYPSPKCSKADTLFENRPSGPFYILDARSFYGAVEQFCSVPVKCVEYQPEVSIDSLPTGVDPYDCICDVSLHTPCEEFPVRHSGRTMFATGNFRTVICGPELQRAVKHGVIRTIHSYRRYDTVPTLRWYSEGIYQQREKQEESGDKVISAVCKALIARLHGKFMQRNAQWEDCPKLYAHAPWSRWTALDITTGECRKYRSIGWSVQVQADRGDAPHCFPAIAAWVTANGREWLRSWINAAGRNHVLYVSTDSLIVDAAGLAGLERRGIVSHSGVGSLRVVGETNDIEIRGPNNLSFGDRHVVSGRPLLDLAVAYGKMSYTQQGTLQEAFDDATNARVRHTTVDGVVDRYTHPGKIEAGGWTVPPILTAKEQADSIGMYTPEHIAEHAATLTS